MVPQRCLFLTFRISRYVILHGKKDFINLIPFGILRWEIILHYLNRHNIVRIRGNVMDRRRQRSESWGVMNPGVQVASKSIRQEKRNPPKSFQKEHIPATL